MVRNISRANMDELDISIIRRLLVDSRTSYAMLAEGLGISIQATQKRVEAMIHLGIIKRFTTRLSFRATGGRVTGLAFGSMTEPNLKNLVACLKAIDQVRALMISSGNVLHIELDLKNISEMESLQSTLRNEARMNDVSLAMIPCDNTIPWPPDPINMNPLELRIIYALRDNLSPAIDRGRRTGRGHHQDRIQGPR